MFEKYDGVRGFWNPVKKEFYSRQGTRLTFPNFIIDAMPQDIFLDGELWWDFFALLFCFCLMFDCSLLTRQTIIGLG